MLSLNPTKMEQIVLSVFFALFCSSLSTEYRLKGQIDLIQQKVLLK